MIIADGRAIAQKILNKIKAGLDGRRISIAAIWMGNDPAVGRFVELKKKYAESIGMEFRVHHFGTDVSEKELMDKLRILNADKSMTGIIVELPLPKNLDQIKVLDTIPPEKDIDILSSAAQENYYKDRSKILPPAVRALELLFNEHRINPLGKTAAVFGQGMLVGMPVSHWLEKSGAKVFRIDEHTSNPGELSRQADIIVSGVGKPGLIHGNMVKKGAVVVDFGYGKIGNKMAGDVEFDSVASRSSLITPVPGGMGPLVIASFLENALEFSERAAL